MFILWMLWNAEEQGRFGWRATTQHSPSWPNSTSHRIPSMHSPGEHLKISILGRNVHQKSLPMVVLRVEKIWYQSRKSHQNHSWFPTSELHKKCWPYVLLFPCLGWPFLNPTVELGFISPDTNPIGFPGCLMRSHCSSMGCRGNALTCSSQPM